MPTQSRKLFSRPNLVEKKHQEASTKEGPSKQAAGGPTQTTIPSKIVSGRVEQNPEQIQQRAAEPKKVEAAQIVQGETLQPERAAFSSPRNQRQSQQKSNRKPPAKTL